MIRRGKETWGRGERVFVPRNLVGEETDTAHKKMPLNKVTRNPVLGC